MDSIAQVRHFNRLVTQRVGALNDHFLARDRPLGEARLLWEIGLGTDRGAASGGTDGGTDGGAGAVLLVRAWREGDVVRARLLAVGPAQRTVATAQGADAVCDAVRAWLGRL